MAAFSKAASLNQAVTALRDCVESLRDVDDLCRQLGFVILAACKRGACPFLEWHAAADGHGAPVTRFTELNQSQRGNIN
jgi:hypothetical protein